MRRPDQPLVLNWQLTGWLDRREYNRLPPTLYRWLAEQLDRLRRREQPLALDRQLTGWLDRRI